jgi:uncharacterized protein (DUF927 family)
MSTALYRIEANGLETKADRANAVKAVVGALKEGVSDPLITHAQAKQMEEMVKALLSNEDYKKIVQDEAAKHGKTFDLHGAKWQVKEAGAKWDYSQCGDSTYAALMAEKAALDAKIKEREKYLQNIPEAGVADPESGEMHYRAVKSSTTTVALTLK